MTTVLVTGANGQLANCINSLITIDKAYSFIFTDSKKLDISSNKAVSDFFLNQNIDWCINCAAYTNVDKAETEQEKAFNVNTLGAKNLAIACQENNVKLIHISTDFVFDGIQSKAYNESDKTNPLSVYGQTKLDGENEIKTHLNKHFIIRTSWLYSEYGNNFLKTMLRLAKEKSELNIVADQIGTPTYAKDLAKVILKIIKTNNSRFGVYHYSNEGVASWYDFAKEVFSLNQVSIKVNPIKSQAYLTPAKRPAFSVLDKTKIKSNTEITVPYWRDSLKEAFLNIK
ncbi:dTDP-4-dehydrorhamnose reductase [Ichthyenterobacterium magnum]|uniref:dTDP-4-dehydrorhamnose reductase n=1 Tax=Ichthyenterobacterium magnum TaxID=1230530 RepID=A0A420DX87_9FLAO|nr:dTDP-4-dehydrorhamnose reductase [Ichthyenterobacterium magnum]RKE98826.1 dTDP-4-dehydrorhamnose reductase [Ichthyenterobacterium magnum]